MCKFPPRPAPPPHPCPDQLVLFPFLSLPVHPAGSGPAQPLAWEARSSWHGAGPARQGQMPIQWLPHEKKLLRTSLSFVGLECGTSCKRGVRRWVRDNGGEAATRLSLPTPSPPPRGP